MATNIGNVSPLVCRRICTAKFAQIVPLNSTKPSTSTSGNKLQVSDCNSHCDIRDDHISGFGLQQEESIILADRQIQNGAGLLKSEKQKENVFQKNENHNPPLELSVTASEIVDLTETRNMENETWKRNVDLNGTKTGKHQRDNSADSGELIRIEEQYFKRKEERKKEEDEAERDRKRLLEILRVCEEYEKEHQNEHSPRILDQQSCLKEKKLTFEKCKISGEPLCLQEKNQNLSRPKCNIPEEQSSLKEKNQNFGRCKISEEQPGLKEKNQYLSRRKNENSGEMTHCSPVLRISSTGIKTNGSLTSPVQNRRIIDSCLLMERKDPDGNYSSSDDSVGDRAPDPHQASEDLRLLWRNKMKLAKESEKLQNGRIESNKLGACNSNVADEENGVEILDDFGENMACQNCHNDSGNNFMSKYVINNAYRRKVSLDCSSNQNELFESDNCNNKVTSLTDMCNNNPSEIHENNNFYDNHSRMRDSSSKRPYSAQCSSTNDKFSNTCLLKSSTIKESACNYVEDVGQAFQYNQITDDVTKRFDVNDDILQGNYVSDDIIKLYQEPLSLRRTSVNTVDSTDISSVSADSDMSKDDIICDVFWKDENEKELKNKNEEFLALILEKQYSTVSIASECDAKVCEPRNENHFSVMTLQENIASNNCKAENFCYSTEFRDNSTPEKKDNRNLYDKKDNMKTSSEIKHHGEYNDFSLTKNRRITGFNHSDSPRDPYFGSKALMELSQNCMSNSRDSLDSESDAHKMMTSLICDEIRSDRNDVMNYVMSASAPPPTLELLLGDCGGSMHRKSHRGKMTIDSDITGSELDRLTKSRKELIQRIKILKKRIQDVEVAEERTLDELKLEITELREQQCKLELDVMTNAESITKIKHQQMELILTSASDRDMMQSQIDNARQQLEEGERRHKEALKAYRHKFNTTSHDENKPSCENKQDQDEAAALTDEAATTEDREEFKTILQHEREALDVQRKLFEDLEFHLLELETRKEEQREPLQLKLSEEYEKLRETGASLEKSRGSLSRQISKAFKQSRADVENLERERHLLMDAFKKERIKFQEIVTELKKIKENSNNDNKESVASSDDDDQICATLQPRTDCLREISNLDPDLTVTSRGQISSSSSFSSVGKLKNELKDLSPTVSHDSVFEEKISNNSEPVVVEPSNNINQSLNGGTHLQPRTENNSDQIHSTNNSTNSTARNSEKLPNSTITYRESNKHQSRPMTRYLPQKDKDVNLRQLIEFAGHHLEENTNVTVSTSHCVGYLIKMGGRFKVWNKRWFVFNRNSRSVSYYSANDEKKIKGKIQFSDIQDVFVDHMHTVKSPSPRLTFCLKTKGRCFYLVAPNPETMRIWIDVLISGAEGYNAYT